MKIITVTIITTIIVTQLTCTTFFIFSILRRTSFFKTRAANSVIVVFGFGAVKFIFRDATGAIWVVLVVVGTPTKIGTPKIIVLQTCLYYMFSSFCFLPIFDDAILKVLLLYNNSVIIVCG